MFCGALAAWAGMVVMKAPEAPAGQDLFVAGQGGYRSYRIPALLVTTRGSLLAFCEGRKNGPGDSGQICVLLRRSADGGRTWTPPQVVARDGGNTVGNPCPVLDEATGQILLLLTRNLARDGEAAIMAGTGKDTRRVWLARSADEGATWSRPADITAQVKPAGWTWYATGPGIGIQLRSGRLLVPCDHAVAGAKAPGAWRSHVIYSDDHGASWHVGGSLPAGTNECQVAELSDGRVQINMRSYAGDHLRRVAVSADGGATWGEATADETLVEPVCQAGLVAARMRRRRVLLFSNPASSTRREALTLRASTDDGRTWRWSRLLWPGPAAYSCPAFLPGGKAACLYERGDAGPYERITLAVFPLAEISGHPPAVKR